MMCNMAWNTEKSKKWEMSTVGPGWWRGNRKRFKMRHTHCRTLNMARKLTTEKRGNGENHIVGHEIWQDTLKNVWNEKHTLGHGIW